ncbi:MAG: hypothetical protein ACXVFU_17480 [Nocardioidaceae bacterium]
MTSALARPALPPVRAGGALRRLVGGTLAVLVWALALFLLLGGLAPSLFDSPAPEVSMRVAVGALGLVLASLPVLLSLPTRRRVVRAVAAVVVAAGDAPRPALPPFAQWAGPEHVFRRLRVTSATYVAIPLLLLVGSAVAFGMFLDEPVAGGVFAGLALVPGFFGWVTLTLPSRLRRGVQAGLEAGQVVPVAVAGRVDRTLVVNASYASFFALRLPEGQRLTVRTPLHFGWDGEAPGVLDDPDLVLVLGRGGHQGLLLAPSRPQDAVWLLGPVPLVRVPRWVQRRLQDVTAAATTG